MTADEVRQALATGEGPPPGAGRRVRRLAGGWANWTFLVDGRHVVRFPRTEAVAAATARELRLLPALRGVLPVPLPRPTWRGLWQGRPWFGYPRLAGRALTRAPLAERAVRVALGEALGALHAFPMERAGPLVGIGGDPRVVWQARYVRLADTAPAVLAAALPGTTTQARLTRALTAFGREAGDFEPVLIHGDLGPEHVLVGRGLRLGGIIDWEDAGLGDPALDYAGLCRCFGLTVARAVAVAAGRPASDAFDRRVLAYAWIAVVQDLMHAAALGESGEPWAREAVRVLARRLAPDRSGHGPSRPEASAGTDPRSAG